MSINTSKYNHIRFLNDKVQSIHNSIADIIRKADSANLSYGLVQKMCLPYYNMLEDVYKNEFPIRNAIDRSDILFRLEGPAVEGGVPQVRTVSRSLDTFRSEINLLTKSIAGIDNPYKRLPKSFELGLSGIARGSLYLGFSVFTEKLNEEVNTSLLGEEDTLVKATRGALHAMGIITKFTENIDLDELKKEMPDPRIRDISLGTLKRISPSKRSGVDTVNVLGKSFPDTEMRTLTSDTRKMASKIINDRFIKPDDTIEFRGTIREIDLDAKRFEIRFVKSQNINDLRCIYPDDYSDGFVKKLLNERVKVKGDVEHDNEGKPKLMKLNTLDKI